MSRVKIIDVSINRINTQLGIKQQFETKSTDSPKKVQRQLFLEEKQFEEAALSFKTKPIDKNQLTNNLNALNAARVAAVRHNQLIEEIHKLDDDIVAEFNNESKKLIQLECEMIALNRAITELECPKDDSFDNRTVVWYSDIFKAQKSSSQVVPNIITTLEDSGMTVRTFKDATEATKVAIDLHARGMLRCFVIGGDEDRAICGKDCTLTHENDGNCLECQYPFESYYHCGPDHHTCYYKSNSRGCWPLTRGVQRCEETLKIVTASSKPYLQSPTNNASKTMPTSLQSASSLDPQSAAKVVPSVPPERMVIYSNSVFYDERERGSFWAASVNLIEDSKTLVTFVDTINSEGESLTVVESIEKTTAVEDETKYEIENMKKRVSDLEDEIKSFASQCEERRKLIGGRAKEKDSELEVSINESISLLEKAKEEFSTRLTKAMCQQSFDLIKESPRPLPTYRNNIGPSNARDAALALAYLETTSSDESVSTDGDKETLQMHAIHILYELSFLKQLSLSAKVVALVTLPLHKKLLNLASQWINIYLPHCLAKVNRVSFGLLSSEDCKTVLEEDPYVPRSRLKLAVPYIGKDVPSKASEFAHPDIVIGMTLVKLI